MSSAHRYIVLGPPTIKQDCYIIYDTESAKSIPLGLEADEYKTYSSAQAVCDALNTNKAFSKLLAEIFHITQKKDVDKSWAIERIKYLVEYLVEQYANSKEV